MHDQPDPDLDLNQWCPFNRVDEENDDLAEAQLEWMYRNREKNGTRDVFRKIGNPVAWAKGQGFSELSVTWSTQRSFKKDESRRLVLPSS